MVANIGSGSVSVSLIDVASSKIVATLDSKSFPIRAKFTDGGKHVLVFERAIR